MEQRLRKKRSARPEGLLETALRLLRTFELRGFAAPDTYAFAFYRTRDQARADIFDYIEMLYNRRRRHSHLGDVSPEAFEQSSECSGPLFV